MGCMVEHSWPQQKEWKIKIRLSETGMVEGSLGCTFTSLFYKPAVAELCGSRNSQSIFIGPPTLLST